MPQLTMETIMEGVANRIEKMQQALADMQEAEQQLGTAQDNIEQAWSGFDVSFRADKIDAIPALSVLIKREAVRVYDDMQAAAQQLGTLVAKNVIAPIAKESNTPVVALTGNSYMPPIRGIVLAERVYQNAGDAWEAFIEALERALNELDVYMACPTYDNALYVVDQSRYELADGALYDDDPDAWLDGANWGIRS